MEESLQNIDLENPEFQNISKLIRFTNQSIFMTGKAGTGKSTFLKYICAHTKKKYVVLAPTGIAAVNAGGVTMHSFFKIPFKPLLPDDPDFAVDRIRKRLKYSREHAKLIKNLELIIIDEISMVRADLIDFIDKVLRVYSGNMRVPFGGKQLLLVGDVFQLEPVVTADMKEILGQVYPNSYFFSARVFREFDIVSIELKKVYRQENADFVSMLDRFRIGQPTDEDIMTLNSRILPDSPQEGDFTMTLATRRDMVDRINEEHLSRLPAMEITYTGKIDGDFPENSMPTSRELTLKIGAQVVFVRNDYSKTKRWVNGTVGRVYYASPSRLEIEFENGDRHVVDPEVWENIVYKYDETTKRVTETILGTFTQYPLRLAWALTIHKSQGLTFGNVIIDVGKGAFSGGQTYVALSRCRSIEGIKMRSQVNRRDVFVSTAILDFSNRFNDGKMIEAAIRNASADDCYCRAAHLCDSGDYCGATEAIAEAVSLRNEMHREPVRRLMRIKLARLKDKDRKIAQLNDEIDGYKAKLSKLSAEYVEMGRDCMDAGDLTPAMANFRKALDLDANNCEALLEMGRALILADEPAEALLPLKKLISLHRDHLRGYYALEDAYIAMDDDHNALDTLLKALAVNKGEASLHSRLAYMYERIGDDESAAYHRKLAVRSGKKRRNN